MANLPFLALLEVFKALVDIDPGTPQQGHGGVLIRWDSNEVVRPMALVSRSWEFAARQILYGSVAIFGDEAASLFLRTVRAKPELGRTVRSLVIGVIEEEESMLMEVGQRETSTLLLQVVNACPRVQRLQVRPHDVRPTTAEARLTYRIVPKDSTSPRERPERPACRHFDDGASVARVRTTPGQDQRGVDA